MSGPWLTVVVPTFDGERYVADALRSVAAQDPDGVEVVVVDDGSTDGTLDAVAPFADRLDLRVDAGVRRGAWTAASNRGLELARAEHATFLHQDDVWLPGRVDAVRRLLDRHPDAALVVHAARFVSPAGADLGPWSLPLPGATGRAEPATVLERLVVQNWLCVDAPVFRRADALRGGGLDTDLWYTADWDLWLRLAASGPTAYDAAALVGFRVHPASQTATRSDDPSAFRRQLEVVLQRHLPAGTPAAARRAALASVELNVALASLSHGNRPAGAPLLRAAARLGPGGLARLARHSRLHERVAARLRERRAAGRS